MKLKDYIAKHYKSNVEFAKANGVTKQLVNEWLNKGFIVIDNKLYSKRKDLKKVSTNDNETKDYI